MTWGKRKVFSGALAALVFILALQVCMSANADDALVTDMEQAATQAKGNNPDQPLKLSVDEIYGMRDAELQLASGREVDQHSVSGLHEKTEDVPVQQEKHESHQQPVKHESKSAPEAALRRSSKGLFEQDHDNHPAVEKEQRAVHPVAKQILQAVKAQSLNADSNLQATHAEPAKNILGSKEILASKEKAAIKPVVTREKTAVEPSETTPKGSVVLREEDLAKNTTTKNETLQKQLEEEKKREEEEKKKKEKLAKEDAVRVRLGIEIASEAEREGTILRCMDGGPQIEAKNIRAPNVSVGIYMLNLEADTGLTTGLFYADFLLFLRQEDKPLKANDPMKNLAFTNGRAISSLKDYGEGVTRVSGTFFFSPDLRYFPFDQQELEIVLEQFQLPISQWEFVPDYHLNGLSPSIRFPGWQASLRSIDAAHANCRAMAGFKVYPGASLASLESAANVSFSRFSYKLSVQRPIMQGFLTNFIPPLIMLTPTVFSYTLDPLQHIAMRFSIAGGALVSIILFSNAVEAGLPPIEYMCLFDKFIFCVYFAVFASLATSVLVAILFRNEGAADVKNDALRERLHNISLRVMCISTVYIFVALFPLWCLLGNESSWVVLILCIAYLVYLFLQWYKIRREQDSVLAENYVTLGGRSDQP